MSAVETTRPPREPAPVPMGGIDCDVHCAPASLADLHPYLDRHWRDYADGSGLGLMGLMPIAYPPGSPTIAGPDGTGDGVPATYEALRDRYLARHEPEVAILTCLALFDVHRHPYYAAALARAVNDWLRAEWLERDDRLRASIVVSPVDPEDAVAEIERLDGDERFVQVLLPIRADAPYGNKRYHRLYATAEERGLVIGLHAWGRPASAPTPTALTLTYPEDYLSNQILVRNHVLSLVSEGVFERFPGLRVTLLECGFAWLPPLAWRFDKDWKGLWREVPWVKERPSAYIERNIRATTAPAHLPRDPQQALELVEMVGTGWLLHASDYPHHHGASVLWDVLAGDARDAVLRGNAAGVYRLGAAG